MAAIFSLIAIPKPGDDKDVVVLPHATQSPFKYAANSHTKIKKSHGLLAMAAVQIEMYPRNFAGRYNPDVPMPEPNAKNWHFVWDYLPSWGLDQKLQKLIEKKCYEQMVLILKKDYKPPKKFKIPAGLLTPRKYTTVTDSANGNVTETIKNLWWHQSLCKESIMLWRLTRPDKSWLAVYTDPLVPGCTVAYLSPNFKHPANMSLPVPGNISCHYKLTAPEFMTPPQVGRKK